MFLCLLSIPPLILIWHVWSSVMCVIGRSGAVQCSPASSSNPCLLMIMLLELPSRPRPPTQQVVPTEDDTLVGQLVNLLCGVICKDTPLSQAFAGGDGHAAGKTIIIKTNVFEFPILSQNSHDFRSPKTWTMTLNRVLMSKKH